MGIYYIEILYGGGIIIIFYRLSIINLHRKGVKNSLVKSCYDGRQQVIVTDFQAPLYDNSVRSFL